MSIDGDLHRVGNFVQQIQACEAYVVIANSLALLRLDLLVMEHLKLFVSRINIPKVCIVVHTQV